MKTRALLGLFAIKLAFTGLAVWFVAARVDLSDALGALSTINPLAVVAAVACALTQVGLASVRFVVVAGMVGARLTYGEAARITFIGGFFGQIFATFVSGDLMRIWLLARRDVGYSAAANAVLLDRVFGVVALVVLIAAGLPALVDVLPSAEMRTGAVALTAGVAGMIGGFVVLGRLLDSARRRWTLGAAPGAAGAALLLGLAVQLLSVAGLYLLFRGMGTAVAASTCFIFVPFVMLITMLPISFAGWGLREGAMVAAFAMVGVAAEATLVVSIAFGLIVLTASLPGLVLWLSGGARMPVDAMGGTPSGRAPS